MAGKELTYALFLYFKDILLVDFFWRDMAISAADYWLTLIHLHTAIEQKCLDISEVVLHLHDTVWLHSAIASWQLLQLFKWKISEDCAYWPDLTLSDYHLFSVLGSHRFKVDDNMGTARRWWSKEQDTWLLSTGNRKNSFHDLSIQVDCGKRNVLVVQWHYPHWRFSKSLQDACLVKLLSAYRTFLIKQSAWNEALINQKPVYMGSMSLFLVGNCKLVNL